jgi:hypothetical protein
MAGRIGSTGRVQQLLRHVAPHSTAERSIEANPSPDQDGPLAGVVLLDLTQMVRLRGVLCAGRRRAGPRADHCSLAVQVSGPMGTQIIADQGADVIKIENTTTGAAERGGARSTMTNPMNRYAARSGCRRRRPPTLPGMQLCCKDALCLDKRMCTLALLPLPPSAA